MAVAGLSARLYLDHLVHPRLAADLRRYGFDVTFAREVGKEGATDEEHLRWATEEGRVVVRFDLKDYPPLARQWSEQGRGHAGILLATVPERGAYGGFIRRLLAFLDSVSAEEMVNRVRWLRPIDEER